MKRKGLQEGFDWLGFIRKPMLVLTLAASATGAVAGIEDGPDPVGSVMVVGAAFKGAAVVPGAVTTGWLPMAGSYCAPEDHLTCRNQCENDITNPYCTVTHSACEVVNGTAACVCSFFCISIGGVQYNPHSEFSFPSMAVRDDESEN